MDKTERLTVTKNIEAYIKSIERKWSSVRAKWRACKNQNADLADWSSWFREFEEIEASLDYLETTMIGVLEDEQRRTD